MRESTYKLREQIKRVSGQARRMKNSSWYDERKARGIAHTSGRPRAQELRAFREWAQQGALAYVHPTVCTTPDRGDVPTMYGGVVGDQKREDDKPAERMAAHAHRSQRARNNAKEHETEEPTRREHKLDTYHTNASIGSCGDTLPTLLPSEERMIRDVCHSPFDTGETDEVRRHPVARMFVRVAAIENGEIGN